MECLTLIMAGARGSGLGALTADRARAGLALGGAYRVIDIVLSNCANAPLGDVGVITQYGHSGLAAYIGGGAQWARAATGDGAGEALGAKAAAMDEDGPGAGGYDITILPPKVEYGRQAYYTGEADALIKNLGFIEGRAPRYVLVLTAGPIYRMDYRKLLQAHSKSGAAATVAVAPTAMTDAAPYDAVHVDKDGRLIGYRDRPQRPKSGLAAMGAYLFDWPALRRHLLWGSADAQSGTDIGRDLVARMLTMGESIAAYRHDGYWHDAGSIYGYWEAHMDMLSSAPAFSLHDDKWPLIGGTGAKAAYYQRYIAGACRITNAIVAQGCRVRGEVRASVVSAGALIGEGATVTRSVVMPGARIGKDAVVRGAIIGEGAVVGAGVVVDGAVPGVVPGVWPGSVRGFVPSGLPDGVGSGVPGAVRAEYHRGVVAYTQASASEQEPLGA